MGSGRGREKQGKMEALREKIKRVKWGNSKEEGRRRGGCCKAECYFGRWSCLGGEAEIQSMMERIR